MDGAPKTDIETVHATVIAVEGRGALIRGRSGAGKSDLALRCLACAISPLVRAPAILVADDRVCLERTGRILNARAPETILGKIEVRGVGIVSLPAAATATLVLAVDLVEASEVERIPDPAASITILGVELPLLRLAPFELSAPLKLLLALASQPEFAGEKNPCVASEPL